MTALWTVDAGGSTTTVLLPDGARRTYGSINPASVGPEEATGTLRTLLTDVAAGGRGAGWIATATVDLTGGAGETARLTDLARAAGVHGSLLVSNDAVPWLAAPPLSGRGVVLVCGTGSGFLAAGGEGGLCRVGGCEYLGSDEGSAFALGLGGLRAAVRAVDGRGPGTTIVARLEALSAGRTPAELSRELAAEAFPKATVAALAPVICDAWLAGDEVAGALVSAAVDELILGVRAAANRAGLGERWPVAAGGGVLRGCPPLLSELERRLYDELPVTEVVRVTDPATTIHAALRNRTHEGEIRPPDGPVDNATWLVTLTPPPSAKPDAAMGARPEPVGLDPVASGGSADPPSSATAGAAVGVRPEPVGSDPVVSGGSADPSPGATPGASIGVRPEPVGGGPGRGAGIAVGLCLAAWGGSVLAAAVEHARLAGADVVDLPSDSTSGLVDLARWAVEDRYRAAVRKAVADVTVGCVSNSRDSQLLLGPHGPHTDPVLAGSADAKREHALQYAMDTVRLAADLGAPHVRLMFGVPDVARWLSWWHSDVSWADNIAAWATQAAPILDLAAEHGVTVLVEPHPKQVVYDRPSARQLLDAAPRATVRLCLDPANLAATGHDPVDAVRGWGPDIGAAHAKDLQRWHGTGEPTGAGWSRYGPGPPIRFRALGAGGLPWPDIVAALLDEGFRGVLYVEHEDALLPREQSVATSMRLLRDLVPQGEPQGRTW
jgi:sugar phosphate isomerase/epimerase/N-acetylglucosamine kinase-like BadF-type ATPase